MEKWRLCRLYFRLMSFVFAGGIFAYCVFTGHWWTLGAVPFSMLLCSYEYQMFLIRVSTRMNARRGAELLLLNQMGLFVLIFFFIMLGKEGLASALDWGVGLAVLLVATHILQDRLTKYFRKGSV